MKSKRNTCHNKKEKIMKEKRKQIIIWKHRKKKKADISKID